MRLRDVAMMPFHVFAIAGSTKSFRRNPILGSPSLNKSGLHTGRIRLAARMAENRRMRMTKLVAAEHREQFGRDGYVTVANALPQSLFESLLAEISKTSFPTHELRQGGARTRFFTLTPDNLKPTPALSETVNGPLFQGLLRFVASRDAEPVVTLHTVLSDTPKSVRDPQSKFHSDTFHPTAKAWLFLQDVVPEDGPFSYVPGSHKMSEGRMEWEYAQSLTARDHRDGHHAGGSFRASAEEIAEMGYASAVTFPVKANTLVVADTHGFHARTPSQRKSKRVAIYGSLRTHPFVPIAGGDIFSLPPLTGRKTQIQDQLRSLQSLMTGKPLAQPFVGNLLATDDGN